MNKANMALNEILKKHNIGAGEIIHFIEYYIERELVENLDGFPDFIVNEMERLESIKEDIDKLIGEWL